MTTGRTPLQHAPIAPICPQSLQSRNSQLVSNCRHAMQRRSLHTSRGCFQMWPEGTAVMHGAVMAHGTKRVASRFVARMSKCRMLAPIKRCGLNREHASLCQHGQCCQHAAGNESTAGCRTACNASETRRVVGVRVCETTAGPGSKERRDRAAGQGSDWALAGWVERICLWPYASDW